MTTTAPSTEPSSELPDRRELVATRTLAAPRNEVFAAFEDPARLALWWGPDGFTNTFHVFELRAGGAWRFTMIGPDGATYEQDKRFLEVTRPTRIALRHEQDDHSFTLTIALHDVGPHTEVVWRMRFDLEREADRVRPFVTAANEQNLDRLEAHLVARRTQTRAP